MKPKAKVTVAIANGKKWRKIQAPRRWNPRPGDELIGQFGGVYTREGMYGSYKVVQVTNNEGTFFVGGSQLIPLVEAAGALTPATLVRIVFLGAEHNEINDHTLKRFEFYVNY